MAVAAIASTETTCEYNIFLVYVQLFFTLGLGRTREQRIDLYFPSALASYIPQLTACFHSGKNRLSQSLYIAPIHSSGDQDKSRGCNLIYMLHIKSPRILNTLLCGDLVASSTETGTLHGTGAFALVAWNYSGGEAVYYGPSPRTQADTWLCICSIDRPVVRIMFS
jgi:hypothetical protein